MAIALKSGKHTSARVASRMRRQIRGRKKISGTAERPRLVVTRSSRHITAQVVDDTAGHTLASASTLEADLRAAYAAGLAVGFWKDPEELRRNWNEDTRWEPTWTAEQREAGYRGWRKAVQRTLDWVEVE